ncbi:MAG TPA: fibrobacter succinogenes major paralogous domain-containing protein [Flavobacteriales bacterium]|nr:fibrobacter succinogenes major paralogous domain-containing protein [Flavobacteriales bacterium]
MKKRSIIATGLVLAIVSCSSDQSPATIPDEKVKIVEPGDEKMEAIKIGNQNWAAKNLNVIHFKNGEEIPQAKSAEEWVRAAKEKKPAWCYYDFKFTDACAPFGRLYNWYAVNDSRGLAPEGWHVPSESEWEELVSFAGQAEYAGKYLKSKNLWLSEAGGVDEYKFSALPAGMCEANGNCDLWLAGANFWTSTPKNDTLAVSATMMGLSYNTDLGQDAPTDESWLTGDKCGSGFSVRCVKD